MVPSYSFPVRLSANVRVQPVDHLLLVALELRIALPVDDAVDAVLDGDQFARDSRLPKQLDCQRRLLVRDRLVFRPMDEEKGRGSSAEPGVRRRGADLRDRLLVPLADPEDALEPPGHR